MNQDRIRNRCTSMTSGELVRAITFEQAQNSVRFRQIALQELEQRGVDFDEFVSRVSLRLNAGAELPFHVDDAVARIDDSLPLWDPLVIATCLDDALVIQRELGRWTCHIYLGESYERSFFCDSKEQLRSFASAFLHLREQLPADEGHHLDNWDTVFESESREQIEGASSGLQQAGIPHSVQSPVFSAEKGGNLLGIIVAPGDTEEALDVLDDADDVDDLYERAEELAEGADRIGELEVYDRLFSLDPENPGVHYNRGFLLLELGRYAESVTAICEAVAIGLRSVDQQTEVADSGGPGGLFGLVALLLRKSARTADEGSKVSYPDYLDDAELVLLDLEERVPDNLELLHGIAAVARLKNDIETAETRYRQILKIAPDDRVAYFNLGYLHSEKGGIDRGGKRQLPAESD